MAVFNDLQLKQWFETGDYPTQQQFFNLIDSKVNILNLPAILGLEIGVTPITNGIDQGVLYQDGLLLGQTSEFIYNSTDNRIGLGTVVPVSRVHLYGDTNANATPLQFSYERPALAGVNTKTNWISHNALYNGIAVGSISLVQQAAGQGVRWIFNVTDDLTNQATAGMQLSQSKQLSIGTTHNDGAVVDIMSKGLLSSDFSLRVRDWWDASNNFVVNGAGQTLVGDVSSTPEASAILQIDSTDRGFLMPRMTTAERDAIINPADGLMLFNTTTSQVNLYKTSTGTWRHLLDFP